MAELIIFLIFGGAFVVAQIVVAVAYKIKTHSKKSILELIDEL